MVVCARREGSGQNLLWQTTGDGYEENDYAKLERSSPQWAVMVLDICFFHSLRWVRPRVYAGCHHIVCIMTPGCRIGTKGAKALALELGYLSQLTELNLHSE